MVGSDCYLMFWFIIGILVIGLLGKDIRKFYSLGI